MAIGGWAIVMCRVDQPAEPIFFSQVLLDDIAVYNTTISASQVYTLYGAGSSPRTACANSTLALQVNTVGADTYSWTGPNSFTSTSQNPTVSTSATTAYWQAPTPAPLPARAVVLHLLT